MRQFLFSIIILLGTFNAIAQNCFDAYDNLFENGGDTLSYNEFRVREQAFLESLGGCMPPDIFATTINGEDIVLDALKGRVVVLNFWFTTCLPCLKEIPLLNELTEQYDGSDVVFLGLARDNTEKLTAFFKRFGEFKYKIIPESHEIATQYKVVGWPQSIVIDRTGKVYKAWAGAGESPQQLVNEIKQAINQCLVY